MMLSISLTYLLSKAIMPSTQTVSAAAKSNTQCCKIAWNMTVTAVSCDYACSSYVHVANLRAAPERTRTADELATMCYSSNFRMMIVLFCPPKPKELLIATVSGALRGWCGT